jgi:DNA-binding MarR family transcriptional regulator
MSVPGPDTPPGDLDALAAALVEVRARLAPMVLARHEGRRAGATPGERLSTPQHLTLLALADGPLTMTALAGATGVALSTATRMVQSLVREGWVAPADPAGSDRRRRPVGLTPAGREVSAAATAHLHRRIRSLLDHLDAGEGAAILAGVRALEKAIQLDDERRARAVAASSAESTSANDGAGPDSSDAATGRMPSRITPR